MSMFVSKEKVAVSLEDDPANIIWIRPVMSFGVQQQVLGDAMQVTVDDKGVAHTGAVNLGLYNRALMEHNIVGWEGPAFAGVPCTPEAIRELQWTQPLVTKVFNEIARRNAQHSKTPSPNAFTSAGG